ncbi:FTR1 family iron permease [Oculatella sp. LEGE 06141]|uniref:FTR1 family iron permease n=1 Tax=Oculatella sp. LEGE 06141 TaxID=1828648 RepID=UPI001880636D|nr:FTR1 family protein [Oculatella sp. LEGE 06141]MBE9179261.1 FTR1 family iron permease [Oculatella sp. LEGE 06141]
MDLSAALPTFVVTLREGVEAALVVGIVLAYLKKAGQSHLNSWVYAGVGVGLAASVMVGALFVGLMRVLDVANPEYAPVVKPLLEGVFGVAAIALLSWMLIWMTQQARSMKAEVEGAITAALQQAGHAGWGVFGLITIAVLREGFETVLFIAAKFQQGWIPALGAVAGLIGAVIIGFLLFQLGIKINLRLFFQGMGVLLLLIVSGLVVSALRHFDAAVAALAVVNPEFAFLCSASSPSCILGAQVWDASHVLPDRQFPGILLKAFFGYTQRLYWVQAIAYLIFLTTVGGLYLQSITGWKAGQLNRNASASGAVRSQQD